MFQRNSALHRIDALISRKFGEVNSKTRGHVTGPGWRVFWATFFVIGRAQNESISRRRHKWHNPRKGAREVSDFATASLIRGCIKDCLCLSSFFHLCLIKTFVHFRLSPSYFLEALSGIATASFRGNRLVPFASECDAPLEDWTNYLNLAMLMDLRTDLRATS